MTIESALLTGVRDALAADVTLSALTVPVFAHVAPQGTSYPFVTYSVSVASVEQYTNTAAVSLTLTTADAELLICADSAAARALISTSLKKSLHGFRGNLGTESLDIRNATFKALSTFSESELTGTDAQIYRASISFSLTYNWV